MSTALLSTPGKAHELSDDLESHFFVLLYSSFHFVEHNKPADLDLKQIFDQATVSLEDGTHRGGVGKGWLYTTGLMTKFKSEPLAGLFRALLKLFRSLRDYNHSKNWEDGPCPSAIEDVKKLTDCVEMKKLFVAALESEKWPTVCDKAEDQYPPIGRLTPQQKEAVAVSFLNLDLTTKSSTGKRKRGDDDLPAPPPPPGPQRRHTGKR